MATGYSDGIRRAAEAARRAAEPWSRPTTVAVILRTYSGAIGLAGTTLTSTVTLTLSPSPKVSAPEAGEPSAFGGGFGGASSGDLLVPEYLIGPITLNHTEGGYRVVDVVLPGAVNKNVSIALTGPAFDGTEEFEVVSGSLVVQTYNFTFRVRRAQQV